MVVRLGLAEGGDDPHRGQGGLPETGEGVGSVLVGDLLPQVELDHCPCRNGLGPRGPRRQDDQQEGHAHEEQQQTGEDASHGQEELFHCGSRGRCRDSDPNPGQTARQWTRSRFRRRIDRLRGRGGRRIPERSPPGGRRRRGPRSIDGPAASTPVPRLGRCRPAGKVASGGRRRSSRR